MKMLPEFKGLTFGEPCAISSIIFLKQIDLQPMEYFHLLLLWSGVGDGGA